MFIYIYACCIDHFLYLSRLSTGFCCDKEVMRTLAYVYAHDEIERTVGVSGDRLDLDAIMRDMLQRLEESVLEIIDEVLCGSFQHMLKVAGLLKRGKSFHCYQGFQRPLKIQKLLNIV